jgi:hypothetical protein
MLNPDIRYLNLLLLIHEFGSISAVAEAAGASEKYLSQIKNRTIQQKGKTPRGVGDDLAIRLGKNCTGNRIWMDERHDAEWLAAGLIPALAAGEPPAKGYATKLTRKQDPLITEAIKLLEATDHTGRLLALNGIKFALRDYQPAAKTRAG